MTDDTARFRAASLAARKAEHHFPADCLSEAALTIEALRAEIARWEAIFPCSGCNPYDGDGPREECPRHGREYAYWVEGCEVLSARCNAMQPVVDAARAWVDSFETPRLREVEQVLIDAVRALDLPAAGSEDR